MREKFERKKRIEKKKPEAKAAEFVGDDDFFDSLMGEAKKMSKDLIIPTGEHDSLLEVQGWIKMPDQIAELMDVQGLPCGLIVMAYGDPDCGKTTFANEALASVQRDGGVAILIKTEDKYSLKRAAAQGVNVKRLMIYRKKTIEEVGDQIEQVVSLIKANKSAVKRKVLIVWDSLAATPCNKELEENRKEFSMDAAKAVRGMLRKVQGLIKETSISFLIINQVYDNMNTFGEKTTPYGGKGAIYHSAILLKFAKTGRIRPKGKKSPDPFCGITSVIEVKKNHLGQPFKTGDVEIDWKGFVIDRSPEYAPKTFIATETEEEDTDGDSDAEIPKGKKERSPVANA